MKVETIKLSVGASFVACAILRAQPESNKNPLAGDRAAIAAGARLYERTCQSCHGGKRSGDRAPALAGNALKHGARDGDIFRTIRDGVRGTQMPAFPGLGTEETWQLVSYICSLSAAPKTATVSPSGDRAAGENIFFGKGGCSTCHGVNGRGGVVGPDLSSAGMQKERSLRDKILDPGNQRGAGIVIVKTRGGREIRGVRRYEDTYSLQIVDISGQRYLLDKDGLTEVSVDEHKSLMPGGFAQRLSPPEIQNVIAYLGTLNGRDFSKTALTPNIGDLTFERMRNAGAEPQNWFTYWGDYQGTHYSALEQINTANVRQLHAAWAVQMPGNSILEATPIVVDGIMYTTGPPGQVFALDARTGMQIWRYERNPKIINPFQNDRVNRGVAVFGNRVFFGTLDAALVALDARTGLPMWEVQLADALQGYGITAAPLVIKDRIIVGVSGGDNGIRGFVDANDAATGKRLWRFHTIPEPGEFGHETWAGDSWVHSGGAPWLTGTYDPDLDLIFWPVGNPGPDLDGAARLGDNLFSCSVVALDRATGERKWHYQFTPGDTHDWDSTQDLIVVDRVFRGKKRKLILHADRNGVFYVLDRTNGTFLSGTPFVRQTWNTGFDKNGRPRLVTGWDSASEGSIAVFPGSGGGTNFQSPSYNPDTGWFYLAYEDYGQRFFRGPTNYEAGKVYGGGRTKGVEGSAFGGIKAINPEIGKTEWDYKLSQGSLNSGVLSTAGGVVFAATPEGFLIALDAKTGSSLWRFRAGAAIAAAPMSYAIEGKQYVAISVGNVLYAFALPD